MRLVCFQENPDRIGDSRPRSQGAFSNPACARRLPLACDGLRSCRRHYWACELVMVSVAPAPLNVRSINQAVEHIRVPYERQRAKRNEAASRLISARSFPLPKAEHDQDEQGRS